MNGYRVLKGFGLLFILVASTFRGRSQSSDIETNLKAAFIYNFTKYIDWPPNDQDDFVIGIVGPSEMDDALKEIAKANHVGSKKIVIRHFDRLDQITVCQLLFISQRCKLALPEILAKSGKGELTISEQSGDAAKGTMFNFKRVGDKLKFEVNTKALGESGLHVSSQLLKLAIIVA